MLQHKFQVLENQQTLNKYEYNQGDNNIIIIYK